MQHRLRRLVTAGAGLAVASAAIAGTPLPDPPFSTGGFVPPDSIAFKQEVAVAKFLTKYSKNRAKCDQKAVPALQLAYEPANPTKIPELQDKWTACVAKVGLKYEAGRDKLITRGTPACLDQATIDGMRSLIDTLVPLLGAIVFCDGDGAAPDPVTGLNIPDFKKEAEGEVAASKVALKAGLYAGKCYLLALKYAFKLGGALDPDVLATIDACFAKASDAGNAAMEKLDQTQKLPACLPLATAEALVADTIDSAGLLNGLNYCASPSGAFVDGSNVS